MQRLLYPLTVSLLLVTGVAHGLLTARWSEPEDPEAQRKAFARLPLVIEDWDGKSLQGDENPLPQAPFGGDVVRRYVNRIDGSVVTLYLAGGRSGPVAADHPPEGCYTGAGYTLVAPKVQRTVLRGPSSPSAQFWVANFSKAERARPVQVRLFWAWSGSGNWEAPKYPRLAFAHYDKLYKLYIVRSLLKADEPLESDPALRFIQVLVPELKKALFATS
jgi:hypothetical protein